MRISPFVGRDGELDAVVTAVAHVTHAGLTAVVISGEAGIGKSRLLAEAADAIDRRGWRVLPVRADGLERHVPYAALGAAMQELAVDNTFAEGLRREALAAADLPVEPGSAGAAFGRACASMSRLLTALAASGPLVVTIDDLHQLDDDSLALLAVVLNRLTAVPIGLIVAMRTHPAESNPAAEELLRRLEDRADVVRIELDMLSPEHLAVVVAGTLGAAPDQALADEVCRRSDGNPYFATEIAQSLLDSHLVVVEAAGARLSGPAEQLHLSRRSAVLRRVLPLSSQARTVARVMAVLRRAALSRIALIAEVTGLTDAQVATAFDDLVRARIVRGRHRIDLPVHPRHRRRRPLRRDRAGRVPAPAPALRRAPVGGSVRARPARARLAPVGVGGTGRCPGRRGAGSSGPIHPQRGSGGGRRLL